MPEPLLYLKAMSAALFCSGLVALMARRRETSHGRIPRHAALWGLAAGVVAGLAVLGPRITWPPANALDRFLVLLLPAAFLVELLTDRRSIPRWASLALQAMLIASSGRILVHGSVYLRPDVEGGDVWQALLVISLPAMLLAIVWIGISSLQARSLGASVLFSLAMAIQAAGMLVMLAGYLKGGSTAFPLAAAVLGSAIASLRSTSSENERRAVGAAVVALFGILFIGRYFGRVSSVTAVVTLAAPLCGWSAEIPVFRKRGPRFQAVIRLIAVAGPLLAVLFFAKRDFDKKMGPLLHVPPHAQQPSQTQPGEGKERRNHG